MTFEEALDFELSKLRETLLKKQHDYGPKNICEFGELGIIVRTSDKLARIKNLHSKHSQGIEPANEAVEDTWLDLAGYSVLAMMWRHETFLFPLENSGAGAPRGGH